MEITTYLTAEGVAQGVIEGPCTHRDFEGRIVVLAYEHDVSVPLLHESSNVGSKPVHQPVVIQKEVDQTTPKFYQALFRGEKLSEVAIEWYRFEEGRSQLYFRVQLDNALVTRVRPSAPNSFDIGHERSRFTESISFAYEHATWSFGASGEVLYTQQWLDKV